MYMVAVPLKSMYVQFIRGGYDSNACRDMYVVDTMPYMSKKPLPVQVNSVAIIQIYMGYDEQTPIIVSQKILHHYFERSF